jgi:hypothetical protein
VVNPVTENEATADLIPEPPQRDGPESQFQTFSDTLNLLQPTDCRRLSVDGAPEVFRLIPEFEDYPELHP